MFFVVGEALHRLTTAYLHADWDLDHESSDAVLVEYARDNDPAEVIRDIDAALAADLSEEELTRRVLNPAARDARAGRSTRDWLAHARHVLSTPLQEP